MGAVEAAGAGACLDRSLGERGRLPARTPQQPQSPQILMTQDTHTGGHCHGCVGGKGDAQRNIEKRNDSSSTGKQVRCWLVRMCVLCVFILFFQQIAAAVAAAAECRQLLLAHSQHRNPKTKNRKGRNSQKRRVKMTCSQLSGSSHIIIIIIRPLRAAPVFGRG